MEKEEFKNLLVEHGYDASVDDGVVMVKVQREDRRRIWREVLSLAHNASFKSSVGISIADTKTSL